MGTDKYVIDLVIFYSNEFRCLRTLLACLKQVPAGINIDSVTLVNVNGIHEEEHEYLKSRPDITRVLDYRKEGEYQWHGYVLDRFMQKDVRSNHVLFIHPDCFPIKENWGNILYEQLLDNYIIGFPSIVDNTIVLNTAVFMVESFFIQNNSISLSNVVEPIESPVFVYKNYDVGECRKDRDDRLFDTGTMACIEALKVSADPFLNCDVSDYFIHCFHASLIFNDNMHPHYSKTDFPTNLSNDYKRYVLQPLYDLYFDKKYKGYKIYETVSNDDCLDDLRSDIFTDLFNLEPF